MLSFFGDHDQKHPSKGPVVSKVQVRKPSRPANATTSSTTKPGAVLSSVPRSFISKPVASGSPSLHANGNGTKRLDSKKPSHSPVPSHISTPTKRKTPTPSRIQSESPSESSPSDSSDDASKFGSKSKRRKVQTNGSGTPAIEENVQNDHVRNGIWGWEEVDERGEWGRGWSGFVGCEEVMRGVRKGWAGGGEVRKGELDKYVAYFPQEGFEKADPLPYVELLYPAPGCRERFILLAPTSRGEFAPLPELRNALRMILNHYIPPSHQHIFGTLSSSLDLDINAPNPVASRLSSPHSHSPSASTPPPDTYPTETIADAIRKALAPNRRDGAGFIRAMERYNTAMQEIQNDGTLGRWLNGRKDRMEWRKWSSLCEVVGDQGYGRIVGPFADQLAHHPKHPEEVARAISAKEDAYGELRHRIIEQTKLGPDSVFVDLGSGVGNCVLQAALQAGSRSYGFELLPVPARCARLQLREAQRRWAMWCLKGNLDVEVHEGDFRTHPQVSKRLREADVVLVNNEVFPPSLNVDLTNMFLDLKDGAIIVSLKPFVPTDFRMNESNCDSFAAIVKLTQHTYHKDWVTWKGDSGVYYVQVIDRSMRRKYEENMNGGRKRR